MGGSRLARSRHPRADHHIALTVEVGQVVCPAQGRLVDIERCFMCSSYRGLQEGPSERLVCAPAARAEITYLPPGFGPP